MRRGRSGRIELMSRGQGRGIVPSKILATIPPGVQPGGQTLHIGWAFRGEVAEFVWVGLKVKEAHGGLALLLPPLLGLTNML
jgi:hypothetical protein